MATVDENHGRQEERNMTDSAAMPSPLQDIKASEEEERRCWICLVSDTELKNQSWSKPCKCKSSLKWAHEACLLKWIAEKSTPTSSIVACAACGYQYKIKQNSTAILSVFAIIDKVYGDIVPYISLAGLGTAAMVASTTYGAFVVYMFCGPLEGERILSEPWSWRTWLGLPMIPIGLILSRLSSPEPLLPLLPFIIIGNRQMKLTMPPSPALTLCLLPWSRIVYARAYKAVKGLIFQKRGEAAPPPVIPADDLEFDNPGVAEDDDFVMNNDGVVVGNGERLERRNGPRVVVGALLLPALASFLGQNLISRIALVRKYFPDVFHQSLIGGCAFVVIKDSLDLLYRYLKLSRDKSRRVLNYNGGD
ncbi:hypothetical protein SmJEL517_g03795 [Synchytrium microbalum]|uniref:RING-CH-type domain-containing protein n=1 Tax=Synchytrium microbalum TaxID=1806994 RepID=A0A507C0H2_9FUNG|nr:uncharacterized protein SmJEL517_g03795 [Synchytrium microbalum]TPX33182.1 hypothetical protein SmJEL517_g03795 [Synchytrium microbalum]